ncbi:hypothetical protein ACS0TY_004796 [Phlomoides rotata]
MQQQKLLLSFLLNIAQYVANHLIECLGDKDEAIQNQAAKLIPMIDINKYCILALLVNQKDKPEILCILLDCLSKLSQNPDPTSPTDKKEVEKWHVMVGPLFDMMLVEPSNTVIFSIDECSSEGKGKMDSNSEAIKHEHCLFTRLCPLLIRLLPLRVFDDLNSLVYGEIQHKSAPHGVVHSSIGGIECIVALMINRFTIDMKRIKMFGNSPELYGRIHHKGILDDDAGPTQAHDPLSQTGTNYQSVKAFLEQVKDVKEMKVDSLEVENKSSKLLLNVLDPGSDHIHKLHDDILFHHHIQECS